jgi:hypothetical protein
MPSLISIKNYEDEEDENEDENEEDEDEDEDEYDDLTFKVFKATDDIIQEYLHQYLGI